MSNKEELIEWAKRLQWDYENELPNGEVNYYTFADSAKDFIDTFLSTIE